MAAQRKYMYLSLPSVSLLCGCMARSRFAPVGRWRRRFGGCLALRFGWVLDRSNACAVGPRNHGKLLVAMSRIVQDPFTYFPPGTPQFLLDPGPRSSAQMIWSVPDSGFLVFGGIRNRAMSATDLWLLQDSGAGWQWSSIAPTGPVPPVMIDHRAVAAKQNGQHVMVIYGGYPSSGNQLHTLDLATRVWVREADVQGDPRQMPTMVWIEELDKVLVFGGRGYQWNNDLRTYSPSDGQWTELSPTGAPPSGRFGSVAVWTGDQMIVHGGFDNYVGPLGRTWHWVNGLDGGNGTWLYNDKPTQPQEAQNSNGAVWDPTLKQMFILEMETGAPKVWAYGIM